MNSIKTALSALFLVGLLCFSAFAQGEKSVLLPAEEAKNLARQCSRPSPPEFTATWTPTADDIKAMEARLSAIEKLKVEKCCLKGVSIEHPEKYYRQYVGILVQGQKLIYINAFAESEPPAFWKEKAVLVCDGGAGFWGALYNPETGKFSELAVNGVA